MAECRPDPRLSRGPPGFDEDLLEFEIPAGRFREIHDLGVVAEFLAHDEPDSGLPASSLLNGAF